MNTDRRTRDCLSDLALDSFLTAENDGTTWPTRARAHLEACASCARRLDELRRDSDEFRARAPIAALAAATARRLDAPVMPARSGPWRRTAAWLATAAAAAAVVLVAWRPGPLGGIRSKGDLQIDVFVKRRGGQVEAAVTPARVSPGDALRFQISTARKGYLGIASIDGAGAVTSYLPPAPAQRLVPLPAGRGQLLDGAIELDGTLGRERIMALVCSEPLATDEVLGALRARLAAAHGDSARVAPPAGLGCREASFWIEKVPSP
jgi:hypothetical protein